MPLAHFGCFFSWRIEVYYQTGCSEYYLLCDSSVCFPRCFCSESVVPNGFLDLVFWPGGKHSSLVSPTNRVTVHLVAFGRISFEAPDAISACVRTPFLSGTCVSPAHFLCWQTPAAAFRRVTGACARSHTARQVTDFGVHRVGEQVSLCAFILCSDLLFSIL